MFAKYEVLMVIEKDYQQHLKQYLKTNESMWKYHIIRIYSLPIAFTS